MKEIKKVCLGGGRNAMAQASRRPSGSPAPPPPPYSALTCLSTISLFLSQFASPIFIIGIKITRLLFIRRPSPPPTQHASDTETLPPPTLLLLFIPVALLLSYILHLRFRTDLSTLADIFAFAFRRSREPKRPAHSARLLLSNRKRESTLILKVKLEK
jgi:hypothetical protein